MHDVYSAIADPSRRRLVELLASDEHPVHALAAKFDVSFQAVSQHLHILHEAGLVARRAEGRERIYTASLGPLRQVHDWTTRYRRFWDSRLDRLGRYLDAQAKRR
jgi:DNA-binding transcriptional ArsR family regulator